MENSKTNAIVSPEEQELIEALLKYPSLEKVFAPEDVRQFQAMKRKMQATLNDLERVVRRGSQEDAAKASKVAEAFQISLNFLDELDARRRA